MLAEEEKLVNAKIKPAFKSFMRENPKVAFSERSFEHFAKTLETADFASFKEFSDLEK